MGGFDRVANLLFENRKITHLVVLLMTLLMIPGLPISLTPADIESYDLESPELTAARVIQQDFTGNGIMVGYIYSVRDVNLIHETGPVGWEEIQPYSGLFSGIEEPAGGILNLSVLQELDRKADRVKNHEIAENLGPLVSEITGTPVDGVLSLPDNFRSFMKNETLLTKPSKEPQGIFIVDIPPETNWHDCGNLECLEFDDPNVTQDHIDLAAHRMANNSDGAFLRWLSNDRAFLPDPDSEVIGPVNGLLQGDSWEGAEWKPGRWSASSAWMLVQFDRELMLEDGWTFAWGDAELEWGYSANGLSFDSNPPNLTSESCKSQVSSGGSPCSTEWLFLALEDEISEEDSLTNTLLIGESPNVEVNREILSSVWLIAMMGAAITVLLWISLRRWTDVVIVGSGLILSLTWMQGSIGWGLIFGDWAGIEIIQRSQFSNLLPILILALGIDDSLHALHRYKEERRSGKSTETSAYISISKVGRAIMLTSFTTIGAFMSNLFSDIPALRSFGIEAGLGVLSAFILTGLWVPLLRYDVDNWLEGKGKLEDEPEGLVRLVPTSWLASTARFSGAWAPLIALLTLLLTSIATPAMLGLKGDFKVEDFLDDESDFAAGVFLVNERFAEEGEPAEILVEGDVSHPDVVFAVRQLRFNMNQPGENDPDRFARDPSGDVELIAIDELLEYAQFALWYNSSPFEETGWNSSLTDNGVNCPYRGNAALFIDFDKRGCITYFFGHMFLYGIPESGGYPMIPSSIISNFIQPASPLDPDRPWLNQEGDNATFDRMVMRFGLRQPEQFEKVELAIEELKIDMSPFQNLSYTELSERSDRSSANESYPVTWTIETGSPITRYIQASRMQSELQGSLSLGVLFCVIILWWGFRADPEQLKSQRRHGYQTRAILASSFVGLLLLTSYGVALGFLAFIIMFYLLLQWGERALSLAAITTFPILIVVVWLYGTIAALGYGLNMVTVAIAAISLGVGIDYVIHVVERFREERSRGLDVLPALSVVGAASGVALVGSALSDITGFIVISRSSMGFFSSFGLFSALMIGLSLIASLILTPAALRIISRFDNPTIEGLESE